MENLAETAIEDIIPTDETAFTSELEEHTENAVSSTSISADEEQPTAASDGERAAETVADSSTDYSGDLSTLCRLFPEISGSDAIGAVGSERYCRLRALGLTPSEAYLAIGAGRERRDNRSHLVTSVPNGSVAPSVGMSQREMAEARELFGDLSDSEIKKLYNKVTR